MYSKIKITFRNGNRVSFKEDEWDDYSYDGKFFSVKKNSINIAMFNAVDVFSFVLEKNN